MASITDETMILSAIQAALTEEIERQMEEELKGIRERVTQRVQAAVGTIATSVLSNYSMERYGRELLIRVKIAGP